MSEVNMPINVYKTNTGSLIALDKVLCVDNENGYFLVYSGEKTYIRLTKKDDIINFEAAFCAYKSWQVSGSNKF